jgi:DNA invertase Pin-like site-specific DNA recombinase
MKVGYARVSTRRQKLDFQIDALQRAGCDMIVAEKISGRERRKPGLAAAMASCGASDALVVWKIDRLGRDVVELVQLLKLLRSSGTGLQVLSGQASLVDVTTVEGRALYSILAAFADLEHEWGRERTMAGVALAKRRFGQIPRISERQQARRREPNRALSRTFNRLQMVPRNAGA